MVEGGHQAPGEPAPAGAPRPGRHAARRAPVGDGPRHAAPGVVRRHPVRSAVAGVVLVLAAALGAGLLWLQAEADQGPPGPRTIVTVAPGNSVGQVTAALVHRHVVHSSFAFRVYLFLHGTPVVRPGGYYLRRNESFGEVRARLAAGPDVYDVTVLPGYTAREVARLVGQVPGHDATRFLGLVGSGAVRSPYQPAGSTVIDGLLGTGTYQVVPGETDRALLEDMVARFDTLASQVDLSAKAAALGVTPYQAVTVASIVQKEGVYPQNIGKVARVVYNRLASGMRLQMDSTVLYAENRDGGTVTSADLKLNSPYNTYLHAGLTPTPICFPSDAALRAALAPTPGPWLYFVVVQKDGTEAFSTTLQGQEANETLARSRGL